VHGANVADHIVSLSPIACPVLNPGSLCLLESSDLFRNRLVLLKFLGLELASRYIAGIHLGVLVPLVWQVIHGEDGRNGAYRYAGTAIDALLRIDVQLIHPVKTWPAIIIDRVLPQMYAVHGRARLSRRV